MCVRSLFVDLNSRNSVDMRTLFLRPLEVHSPQQRGESDYSGLSYLKFQDNAYKETNKLTNKEQTDKQTTSTLEVLGGCLVCKRQSWTKSETEQNA